MPVEGYRYGSAVGERIARILSELGYAHPSRDGALQISKICSQVNRKNLGPRVTTGQLQGWIYRGRALTVEDAALLCESLGMDLLEVAFGTRQKKASKPGRIRGVLDEVEPCL